MTTARTHVRRLGGCTFADLEQHRKSFNRAEQRRRARVSLGMFAVGLHTLR